MLIDSESLRLSATTSLFEGAQRGGVQFSIYLVDYAPVLGHASMSTHIQRSS
jgi:hypothetical protein